MMKLEPDALKRWEQIPTKFQLKLLNNVYCSHCVKMRSIGNATGKMVGNSLVLNGICTTCGGKVARVIIGEDE
jgi:hypothetical protein